MQEFLKEMDQEGFLKLPFLFEEGLLNTIEIKNNFSQRELNPGKRGLFNDFGIYEKLSTLKEFQPVRTIFFNKTHETNWFVPWHQDLTVALKEKEGHPEFKNWTVKDDNPHAEAPLSILEKMITLRIFLDPANEENGGLWVLPRSHRLGRIKRNKIEGIKKKYPNEICLTGERGTAYLFSPLILHRSEKSVNDQPRRVLQIEMAPKDALPKPLEWFFNS